MAAFNGVVILQIKDMIIKTEGELGGVCKISGIVASVLKEMKEYARVGMTTRKLDDFGAGLLKDSGAVSAPAATYKFPGSTCISINNEMAHGIGVRGGRSGKHRCVSRIRRVLC